MAIPHERSPFLGMKRCPHGLPESIQCGVGHLQNMELVHDDGDPRQGLPNGFLVGPPHINDHAPDPPLVGKVRKISGDGRLVTVGKHLDHEAGGDVREDRPRPPDKVDLVDPQDLRGLETEGILEILGVVIEDLPDGEGSDFRLLCQLAEGVAEGLFLKPGLEPGRHEPLVVDGRKGLIEGPSTGFAAEAPGIDGDPDPFSVDGEVPDPLLPASESNQVDGTAMDASSGRGECFGLDLVVPVGILDLENTVGGKVQEVWIHGIVLVENSRKSSHIVQSDHYPSSLVVKPIGFLFSAGGSISWRIASNSPIMASS